MLGVYKENNIYHFTASSSKAEYEMLGIGIDDLEKEVESLEEKKRSLEENLKSTTAKLSLKNSKLAETVRSRV
jgi:hypothetical protein